MSELVALFAKNMRLLRKKAGLSQEELAFKAGLHRTYIGSVERCERNITLKNVEKIAQALEVEPVVLVSKNLDEPSH